jgi:chaperonin GroEL
VALLRAGKALDELKAENDDQKTGINIVRKALSWPARLIAITTRSRVPPQSQVY